MVFQFRLATVLKLREAHRDEMRQQYAEGLRAEAVLLERQQELDAERSSLVAFRREALVGAVHVDQLVHAQRYGLLLESQERLLHEQRATLAAEIERRRQAVVEADREVRVLERLRETQQERHRDADQARDQRVLDEIAARRRGGAR